MPLCFLINAGLGVFNLGCWDVKGKIEDDMSELVAGK